VPPSKDLPATHDDKLAQRRAAEQDVLLREVDEGVRQDELLNFAQRYGVLVGLLFVLAMVALGAGLWWKGHRENVREERSEKLVTAFDALEGGRIAEGKQDLAPMVKDGGPAGSAIARLSLAALAVRENRADDAAKQFEAVAADGSAPKAYRDIATIRLVALRFDQMKPDDVIARLRPLAAATSPWFGSAGELVAMAYLKQGRNDQAGPLLAAIARDENQPATLRSRTRQLAGLLGYDAVVDVDKTMGQLRQEQGAAAPAPPAAAPAATPAATPAAATPAAPAPR